MNDVIPSFSTGFARNAGESKYPELWRGLAGLWAPFLGATGGNIFDLSGNDNTGTPVADTHFEVGRLGPALKFDGTGDFVDLPTLETTIENDSRGTVLMWVMRTGASGGDMVFVHSDLSTDDVHIQFVFANIDRILYRYRDATNVAGDDFFNVSGDTVLVNDRWYQLGFVSDGNAIKLYVDSREEILTTGSGNPSGKWFSSLTAGNFDDFIGKFDRLSGPTNFLTGSVGFAAIWHRALSALEFAFLQSHPAALFELADAPRGKVIVVPSGITILRRRRECA